MDGISMLDWINAHIMMDGDEPPITMEEWCRIRRGNDPDEITDAVRRMEEAGGYDNLE